jgi:hypothetical protein
LTAAIATQIPKYKHGKNANDDYEGPAIVGDGGRKEAIIRESGEVEITSDRPQLTYVKKRDVVLPDVNQLINYVLAGHMGGRLRVREQPQNDGALISEVKSMKKEVVSAIKKIPQPTVEVQGILKRRILKGDNSNEYLNNHLQG